MPVEVRDANRSAALMVDAEAELNQLIVSTPFTDDQ